MSGTKTPELALMVIQKAIKEHALSLDLGCCGLTEIPEEVFEMNWLEALNMGNYIWHEDKKFIKSDNNGPKNRLSVIPEKLKQLAELKILRLSGVNDVEYVVDDDSDYDDNADDEFVFFYENVKYDGNWDISIIPDDTLPPTLIYLDLSNNIISSMQGLDNLTRLAHLDLSKNEIKKITGLGNLKQLTNLDLSDNHITEITALQHIFGLSCLHLFGNPLKDVPRELLGTNAYDNCLGDILKWWIEMEDTQNTATNK